MLPLTCTAWNWTAKGKCISIHEAIMQEKVLTYLWGYRLKTEEVIGNLGIAASEMCISGDSTAFYD